MLLDIILFVWCVTMTAIAAMLDKKIKSKNNIWIVYECCEVRRELVGGEVRIIIDAIIRQVRVNTKEEAIGWFVENTKQFDVIRRLGVNCYKLEL